MSGLRGKKKEKKLVNVSPGKKKLKLAVVLDVLPAASLRLSHDAAGHRELLRAQCRHSAPAQYHDPDEAALRDHLIAALHHFELGYPPDPSQGPCRPRVAALAPGLPLPARL